MAKLQENHRTEMVEKERIIHNQQTTIEQQRAIIEMHEHRQMSMGVEKKEEEEDWFKSILNLNEDESQRPSGASSRRGCTTPCQGSSAAPSAAPSP